MRYRSTLIERVTNMGSVGGSGGTAFRKALSSAENRIYDGNTETAIVIDQNGKMLLDKSDGEKSQVAFTNEETSLMENAILTHNHPSSTTFSWQDLQLLVMKNLSEIRAVAKNGGLVYSLKRETPNAKTTDFWYDYYVDQTLYKQNTVDAIWNSSAQTDADAAKCNKMCTDYMHQWLTDNASKYGYKYTQQKRK